MLSLQKLLVLLAIIGAVWYGFKMFARIQEERRRNAARAEGATQKSRSIAAEDLVECPVCKSYVTASGNNGCGRANCPYRA